MKGVSKGGFWISFPGRPHEVGRYEDGQGVAGQLQLRGLGFCHPDDVARDEDGALLYKPGHEAGPADARGPHVDPATHPRVHPAGAKWNQLRHIHTRGRRAA